MARKLSSPCGPDHYSRCSLLFFVVAIFVVLLLFACSGSDAVSCREKILVRQADSPFIAATYNYDAPMDEFGMQ